MTLLEHHAAGVSACPDILSCPNPRHKDAVSPQFVTTSETLDKSSLVMQWVPGKKKKKLFFYLDLRLELYPESGVYLKIIYIQIQKI